MRGAAAARAAGPNCALATLERLAEIPDKSDFRTFEAAFQRLPTTATSTLQGSRAGMGAPPGLVVEQVYDHHGNVA
ncbi:hypothetical protein [Nonomuraea basaltis]|uniref:hypothetical protein n=1 Tax=Nonomuraea basaltis TaxID=2495887 RepID=UPI001F105FE8|nr:hypothetical protein [Nonomuraea basaltis]